MSTQLTVVQDVRATLDKMSGEFRAVLPDHIEPGALIRVAQTAMQLNPDLQACTRSSLLAACTKAAEAGLLPDGEQGALVAYNVKVGKGGDERWEKQAKFLPMVTGLRDLVRRSGVIKEWKVRVVYDGDEFDYVDGDEERLTHKPAFKAGAAIQLVYSIAYDMDGSVQSRCVMRIDQVEAIRRRSRSADRGPWVTDYEEMVKKTCLRRHYKSLPRAKDDLQRERMMGAVRSLDDAEGVIDVQPTAVYDAPRLSHVDLARQRMANAIETSAYDDAPAAPAVEQPKRAPRKRRTADERLADAEGRAPANPPAAPAAAAQQTRAPASSEPDHAPHSPSSAPHAESPGYPADEEPQHTRTLDDDGSSDEPEVEAYKDGWRARFTGKTRVPPRSIATQDEVQAFFAGYDAAQRTVESGDAPTNADDSESLLSRMIDRHFA